MFSGTPYLSCSATKRNFVFAFAVTALAIALCPWALYGIGLQGVEGRPQLPAREAPQAEQAIAWQSVRGIGAPCVPRLNPYAYWALANHAESKAGVLLAWQVAASHLLIHRRYQGMHWWHLSGAALTIWLTRNWSTEQLLSKLVEMGAQNAARPSIETNPSGGSRPPAVTSHAKSHASDEPALPAQPVAQER